MRMDIDEAIFVIGIIIVVLLTVTLIPIWVYDKAFIAPYAAEDALTQCREQGFTTYSDFDRILFGTKALGVKCEHPIKNYNIDGNGMIIIPAE